jgi:hypothetical protein
MYKLFLLTIMDHDSPKVNKDKHGKVKKLVHRNHICVEMIRKRLKETITGVESMRSKRGRNYPLVVKLKY